MRGCYNTGVKIIEAVICEDRVTIYELDDRDPMYQRVISVQYVDRIKIQISKEFK